MKKMLSIQTRLFLTLSIGALALSACATQGASRYGDSAIQNGAAVPCGAVMVPCGYIIENHAVQVTPPPYLVPAPCPMGRCQPVSEPPVYQPPVAELPPVAEPLTYIPEPAPIPYEPLPPLRVDRPVVDDYKMISCPEGSIPGYGGIDCIPIAVPRK